MIPKRPQAHLRWPRSRGRRFASALASAALLAIAACSDSDNTPSEPTTPAGIAGRITSVVPSGNFRGYVRVEFNPNNPNEGPKAVVGVTGATTILTLAREEGDFRNLSNGIWVRVWFEGAVAESYPVQGTAGTIVIDSIGSSVMNRAPR